MRASKFARNPVSLALVALLALIAMPVTSAGALALSPLNGTPDASPDTQISFLGVSPSQIASVSVVGSSSGAHPGRLEAYASALGASFLPFRPFREGESVRVSAVIGSGRGRRRVRSGFVVAKLAWYPARRATSARAGAVQSFRSEPGLHPPSVRVTVNSAAAAPGDVFLAPANGVGQHGAMIIDSSGQLVWFRQAPAGQEAMDVQVQRYENQPVLVWWHGRIDFGVGFGADEIYNSSYVPVARVGGGNGYQADLHELQITPQGSAFTTAYSLVRADLSSVRGSRDGTLLDAIMQEIDLKTGLVMFEWHAWGHVPLSDSYTRAGRASEPWDYFHLNSISLGPAADGNFIISARNTWAAYEISAHTGAVLWQLGGRHSSFRMGRGTGMAWQHDVRWQPDGTLSIFDDGATPRVHPQSRGLRERIDWRHRTVTLIARYVHSPPLLAGSQGNEQILANGNSFIGWGEEPYFTEFSPSGQVLYDAHMPATVESYRAYRFPWSATPTTTPAIAASRTRGGALEVFASWNGATGVSAWRVLGGPTPATLSPITTAARTGFETAISLQSSASCFAVQALAPGGGVLATSRAVKP